MILVLNVGFNEVVDAVCLRYIISDLFVHVFDHQKGERVIGFDYFDDGLSDFGTIRHNIAHDLSLNWLYLAPPIFLDRRRIMSYQHCQLFDEEIFIFKKRCTLVT